MQLQLKSNPIIKYVERMRTGVKIKLTNLSFFPLPILLLPDVAVISTSDIIKGGKHEQFYNKTNHECDRILQSN